MIPSIPASFRWKDWRMGSYFLELHVEQGKRFFCFKQFFFKNLVKTFLNALTLLFGEDNTLRWCICVHIPLVKVRTYTFANLLLLLLRNKRSTFHNQKECQLQKLGELCITFGINSQFPSDFDKMYIFWEILISFARVISDYSPNTLTEFSTRIVPFERVCHKHKRQF